MPQGTVKTFDHETSSGSILLDDAAEVALDPTAFAASGLLELRLGQRVRFELDVRDGRPTARDLQIVSL